MYPNLLKPHRAHLSGDPQEFQATALQAFRCIEIRDRQRARDMAIARGLRAYDGARLHLEGASTIGIGTNEVSFA